jgi:hypothetical protein
MLAKPLDLIVGQPTTDSMDRMLEQMAQMVAPVKTTAWGGLYGSLALVLGAADYAMVIKNIVTLSAPLTKLTTINPKINKLSNPYEILTLQEEMKTLQKEFELQEAVTTIGEQRIINRVKEQYVKELKKDYFGYANQTIKLFLTHLCTNWCKVKTKERTNAQRLSIRHGSPRPPTSSPSAISSTNNKRSARTSISSSWKKPKPSTSLVNCTRATTTPKNK